MNKEQIFTPLKNKFKKEFKLEKSSENESSITFDAGEFLSEGETLYVGEESFLVNVIRETKKNFLVFRHLYKGAGDNHTIAMQKFETTPGEEEFVADEIFSFIKNYLEKQFEEKDYAINGDMAKRVSILKQVSKMKNDEIVAMQKELDEYNKGIADVMLEETKRRGLKLEDVVVLKDNTYVVCLEQKKKYYIKDMVPIFNMRNHHSDVVNFKPYVHLVLGRVQPGGKGFNPRIIDHDNYRKENKDYFFNKTEYEKVETFSTQKKDVVTNETTYTINDKAVAALFDGGTITKVKSLVRGEPFFHNTYKRVIDDLVKEGYKIPQNDEKFFLFKIKGVTYLYFVFDTEKNFIVNKKNLVKLAEMAKEGSKYLIAFTEPFEKRDVREWGEKNRGELKEKLQAMLQKG